MDQVSHSRMPLHARLPVAVVLLALLCALALSVARPARSTPTGPPLNPNEERPSFVVIQTDDQTLDGLYATFTPTPARRTRGRCRTRST